MLAQSSLLGNLLADFVRGNPASEHALNVVTGIMMHHRVDVLADSPPQVKTCRGYLSSQHRRVVPINLDVVWDHFLAPHWQQLEPLSSLHSFTQQALQTNCAVPAADAAALSEPKPPPGTRTLARTLCRITIYRQSAAKCGHPPTRRGVGGILRRHRTPLPLA